MVVTQFGTVEFDPMRVPTAASMDRGARTDTFARQLDAHRRELEVPAEPAAETAPPPAAPATAAEPAPAAEPDHADVTASPDAADASSRGADAPANAANHRHELPSRGEPDRRIQASEGAGAPLESPRPTRPAAPTLDTSAVLVANAKAGGTAASTTFAATAAAIAPRGDAVRVHGAASAAPLRAATAPLAATGYRTLTPQALQHDAQARDSVFKQILFKLGTGGGEMRLRLDPPELGELDLHLTVENGNQLRLSIGAERADLRDLLRQGLPELQQRLAASGLQIAHAEVHERQPGDRRSNADADRATNWHRDDDAVAIDAPRAGTGWYTTQGLDFWV